MNDNNIIYYSPLKRDRTLVANFWGMGVALFQILLGFREPENALDS